MQKREGKIGEKIMSIILDHFYVLFLVDHIKYQDEEVKNLFYMMEDEQDYQSQEKIEVFEKT